jgi:putative transposase
MDGELATLGIKIAASTIWEILKAEGINPAPDRTSTVWADFLRSQADALLACDFIETMTLTGQRQYILAVIEHASRCVRILGTTAHPTAGCVAQAAKDLVMDLEDAGTKARYIVRDRDAKLPEPFDQVLADAGIQVVLSGVRMPRMNSIMERWVQTLRHELLDQTLIWNERHLRHALHQFKQHHNAHRPHQAKNQAAPLHAVPEPITDPERITSLDKHRHDRRGGVIHEYHHAA